MEDYYKQRKIEKQKREEKFKKLLKQNGIKSIELEEHLCTKKINKIYKEKEIPYYPKFKIEYNK